MNIALFGVDGIRYLDEVSDRNIVYYYRIELERLDKGQFTTLTTRDRKKLLNKGIICITHMGRGTDWYLTDKGKMLLYSIQQEHKH